MTFRRAAEKHISVSVCVLIVSNRILWNKLQISVDFMDQLEQLEHKRVQQKLLMRPKFLESLTDTITGDIKRRNWNLKRFCG